MIARPSADGGCVVDRMWLMLLELTRTLHRGVRMSTKHGAEVVGYRRAATAGQRGQKTAELVRLVAGLLAGSRGQARQRERAGDEWRATDVTSYRLATIAHREGVKLGVNLQTPKPRWGLNRARRNESSLGRDPERQVESARRRARATAQLKRA